MTKPLENGSLLISLHFTLLVNIQIFSDTADFGQAISSTQSALNMHFPNDVFIYWMVFGKRSILVTLVNRHLSYPVAGNVTLHFRMHRFNNHQRESAKSVQYILICSSWIQLWLVPCSSVTGYPTVHRLANSQSSPVSGGTSARRSGHSCPNGTIWFPIGWILIRHAFVSVSTYTWTSGEECGVWRNLLVIFTMLAGVSRFWFLTLSPTTTLQPWPIKRLLRPTFCISSLYLALLHWSSFEPEQCIEIYIWTISCHSLSTKSHRNAASNNAYYGHPELWILRYPAHRHHAVP
jgi:hypothetical protein